MEGPSHFAGYLSIGRTKRISPITGLTTSAESLNLEFLDDVEADIRRAKEDRIKSKGQLVRIPLHGSYRLSKLEPWRVALASPEGLELQSAFLYSFSAQLTHCSLPDVTFLCSRSASDLLEATMTIFMEVVV